MSVAAITAAWKVECEPTQKLVLLALADHANDETWKCWPSLGHLAKKTGLNRRTVSRSIQSLLDRKLIGRINRGRESTVYQLNVATWGHETPRGTEPLGAESHGGRGDTPLGVGAQSPKGRGTVPHEPSGNRQEEPSGNRNVSSTPASTRFSEFWEAWPSVRKRDRKKAERIWQRRKLDRMADTIIADVRKRQVEDNQWVQGFVPMPTTYLNGDRWEDVIETQPKKERGESIGTVDY